MFGGIKTAVYYTIEARSTKGAYTCTWQVERRLQDFKTLRVALVALHGAALQYRLHHVYANWQHGKADLGNLNAFLQECLKYAAEEQPFRTFYSLHPDEVVVLCGRKDDDF